MNKLNSVILIPYTKLDEASNSLQAEAKMFYENMFSDAEEIQVLGTGVEGRLYVKDDFGLYIIGVGKINASMYCTALLSDDRFNLDDTKFILCGCCGSARGAGVPGDIYFVSETVDYDLGHRCDARELKDNSDITWFANKDLYGHVDLNNSLLNSSYKKFMDEKLNTTHNAKDYMSKTFNGEDWAIRDPKVMMASSVTSDCYWKGNYEHEVAKYICEHYNCKAPYMATQMEDVAVAVAFKEFNKLDNLLIIRYSVNMDVFMAGQSPENLWMGDKPSYNEEAFDNFEDIFPLASKQAFDIVKKLILTF